MIHLTLGKPSLILSKVEVRFPSPEHDLGEVLHSWEPQFLSLENGENLP